jgi:hypothetical protein
LRDWRKPRPPTELEELLEKHEVLEKKYNSITKKYWNTNAHLLDDDEIFLQIYSERVQIADNGWEAVGGRLKRKCSIFNI